MTEALITELAQLRDVSVINRVSVMRYKGGNKTIAEIAAELQVDGIVVGGAVTAENRVAVTAQLVRASSQDNIWAERYERDLRDVVTLQSEIARTIGRQIGAVLTPEAEARFRGARTVNPDAYQLTQQGRFFANQLSREALERGIRYFEEATGADPEYAPAYAGLAFAYGSLSSVHLPPRQALPRAREAALRAIDLDSDLAEGHAWLGFVALFFDYDQEAARRSLERALALNPSSVDARILYSNYLISLGRLDDAIAEIRRAQELDPRSVFTYSNFGSQWTLFMARRYKESLVDGQRALELDPNYSFVHSSMGLAHVQLGDFERGIAALREAVRLEDTPMLKAFLAYGYAVAGRRNDALALIEEVAEVSRKHYTCAYEIAVAYAALDNREEAFRWLDKAVEDRADCIPYLLVDPRLDRLRADPQFELLVKRVGLRRENGPA
jgi:tetratricopeptide (TPR) repeat protein